MTEKVNQSTLDLARRAKDVASSLAMASAEQKNSALLRLAEKLIKEKNTIIAANQIDMEHGKDLSPALQDRLLLDDKRITAMAEQVKTIAALPDPVGAVINQWTRPNGLLIKKIACPLGVVLAIYESRPNVSVDIAALALKSGNVAILRGGSASFASSKKLVELIQDSLQESGLPREQTQMVMDNDRAVIKQLLQMHQYIDVVVPRGGQELIKNIRANATMPVFAHEDGNCHVYVDGTADVAMAADILYNSKLRRVGVCGAMESWLLDKTWLNQPEDVAVMIKKLIEGGVEFRACPESYPLLKKLGARVSTASEADYGQEYLDKIMSVKVVDGVDQAITHINHYGSHHTDAIITRDKKIADRFLRGVESAIILHNASTQFADGGEFGFGAEVGIATGKFHARGPVGLNELCSYYYQVLGQGQCRP